MGTYLMATARFTDGVAAQGRGPGVILLHSSLSSKSQWKPLAAELARSHHVLSLDLIGYGDAPAPLSAADYDLGEEVERVFAIADTWFGPGSRFQLVGHSFGGAIALAAARARPARIGALAAYEPVCFNALGAADADGRLAERIAAEVTQRVAAGDRLGATEAFFDFWNGPGAFGRLPEAARLKLAALIGKVPLEFRAAFREAYGAASFGAIEAPALLLGGTRSAPLTRRVIEALGAAMPRAALGWIEGGDHMAPLSRPAAVNPRLLEFLRGSAALDVATALKLAA